MTTDIERQFFETFGIESKNRFKGCTLGAKFYSEICKEPCKGCKNEIRETIFPQITDRHYLLILARYGNISHYETMTELTLEEIKELIIKDFLVAVDSVDCITRYQVDQYIKTLFKEG